MTEKNEQFEIHPKIFVVNTTEQVKTILDVAKLARKTTGYARRKNDTLIFINQGNNQITNPTLAEYFHKAEKKIVAESMPAIVEAAKQMIDDEINQIKNLLDQRNNEEE